MLFGSVRPIIGIVLRDDLARPRSGILIQFSGDFLRSFTLGRHGFTVRDGNLGIQRVSEQCDRMKKRFASGPYTKQVATLLASARARIVAAETRLALLAKKHTKPA